MLVSTNNNTRFIIEPLQLGVGKEYNLNNIKEIKVTEDFLGLSVAKRKCQNEESYEECKTRNYIDALMKTCKCLPFVIGQADKVISLKQNVTDSLHSMSCASITIATLVVI